MPVVHLARHQVALVVPAVDTHQGALPAVVSELPTKCNRKTRLLRRSSSCVFAGHYQCSCVWLIFCVINQKKKYLISGFYKRSPEMMYLLAHDVSVRALALLIF